MAGIPGKAKISVVDRDFDDIRQKTQEFLLTFLTATLELGFTYVRLARMEAGLGNAEGFERARQKAQAALAHVKQFEHRLIDEDRLDIQARSQELEKSIASLFLPQ